MPPKAPSLAADIKEHKKHAKEILEAEEFKKKPKDHPRDEVEEAKE